MVLELLDKGARPSDDSELRELLLLCGPQGVVGVEVARLLLDNAGLGPLPDARAPHVAPPPPVEEDEPVGAFGAGGGGDDGGDAPSLQPVAKPEVVSIGAVV